ncbi:hypothetical protein NYQ10_13885 [Flavobacterium johnsoniae]|uniref:hypothetical protein n=1 Tax=Flavobacterium TaxID=237 RepID=UPI0023E4515C|nr:MULTISPECIES: hypothetical protein [Flavobacterium]WET03115.1 hypothetical protein P0R33_02030 [Flavobacterium sp. YJ01]WJS93180.1 hypothetical protein NYQ10_13885 [Flavobacterium johnsoniae]
MSDFLTQFGEDLKKNVPGFIAVSVAEIASGMSYYSQSVVADFDPELASAYNLEVVKAKMNAIKALNLHGQVVDNIMITLSSQMHIIDVSDNQQYFIYLAVDSTRANLGMTKSILNKYKKEIATKL